MDRKRLLYWDTGKSTFVRKDLEILRFSFDVTDKTLDASRKALLPLQLLYQFFHSLFVIPRCAAIVVQFAGYHSYVPFVVAGWFGKKRVIVAGGTDCVAFPSIQYGNFQRKYLKWFTAKSFQLADLILPVDATLIDYEYTYTSDDHPRQGYRNFAGKVKAKEVVIYNGYDPEFWKPRAVERKKNSFITVGANLHSRFAFRLKGIDLFIELARRLPEAEFAIVGGMGLNTSDLPANVKLLSNIPNEKLPELFSSYEYYVQLSISEGFPNALTEAILCGCIPVVSRAGAMPFIVNDENCVLQRKNTDDLVTLVKGLMSATSRTDYRGRAATNFTFERRREQLLTEINTIIKA